MLISMHQPDYLPWLGYFNKIARSDNFIFFDTAGFSKGGFHERNKVKTATGWAYLTIPISHKSCFGPLKNVELTENIIWAKKHWCTFKTCYERSPYWENYSPFFENMYANINLFKTLADLNIHIISYMAKEFGLEAKLSRASDYPFDSNLKSTEAILAIIKQAGATAFLAGPSGKDYLNQPRFLEEGIILYFQDYHAPVYNQKYPPFVHGLSAVDLLFNEGPKSVNYLKS